MRPIYIITGADGHLGSALVRILRRRGWEVRGLVMPGHGSRMTDTASVQYGEGDVRDVASLHHLFQGLDGREIYVIHTAGIVDISREAAGYIWDVNVEGTRNIIGMCREYGVKRLVYVSSVHAIPEKTGMAVIREENHFSPDSVEGLYAKTKAEATQAVLDAAAEGLDAVVVQPSGILGPYGSYSNYMVQLLDDYVHGRLPACVRGGYDFVDVRDVARGCLQAVEKGRTGQCYILSNRHYEIREILDMARQVAGGRRLPVLPMWMARAALPLMERYAKRRKERPLYTAYSLYVLESNDRFSHDKATGELGYCPRDLRETVRDTIRWQQAGKSEHRRAVRGLRKEREH